MNLQISGHHLELTDAIRGHVHEKLTKISRHNDDLISISVVLSVEKRVHKTELHAHLKQGDFNAFSESDDLYQTIDNAIDKLDRQIIKHKEKQQDRR